MVEIKTKSKKIGKNVKFGKNIKIVADSVEIEDEVILHDDITIRCIGSLKIGHHSIIGSGARIGCNNLTIGNWLYACEGLEIGSGGCFNKESNVTIGNRVGIFERVLINPNSEVIIGDNCGIGREVQIWTHGAWLDPIEGFPSDFGPVTVGDNVWLPSRVIMLPNSSIGDNCVIGINSIINKKIPSGSFAAGCPAKILKENAYPSLLTSEQINEHLNKVIFDWQTLINFKVPALEVVVEVFDGDKIKLLTNNCETIFDCSNKKVIGDINEVSEDLRDYLRRRGIKIYTDNFFNSIKL